MNNQAFVTMEYLIPTWTNHRVNFFWNQPKDCIKCFHTLITVEYISHFVLHLRGTFRSYWKSKMELFAKIVNGLILNGSLHFSPTCHINDSDRILKDLIILWCWQKFTWWYFKLPGEIFYLIFSATEWNINNILQLLRYTNCKKDS